MKIDINDKVLSQNDKLANKLREFYASQNKYVINLMSSPGSGKTTLLEGLASFKDFSFCVVEGDLQTNRDAKRLEDKGILANQICTGEACHLDAKMVEDSINAIKNEERFKKSDFIFIENVGNLVCPASYDLGANLNVVLLSTPEGDDKVLKYPSMFLCANLVLISKFDVAHLFGFDSLRVENDLKALLNPAKIINISKDLKTLEVLKDFFLECKSNLKG